MYVSAMLHVYIHTHPLLSFIPLFPSPPSPPSPLPSLPPPRCSRLSSVSSNDALSPAEFSEAFSPPITPVASSHAFPCASPLHSPPSLISPPLTPRVNFEISPHIHPLYLFADFAPPRKKVNVARHVRYSHVMHCHGHVMFCILHMFTRYSSSCCHMTIM